MECEKNNVNGRISLTFPLPEKISSNKFYSGMHYMVRKRIADNFHAQVITNLIREKISPIEFFPVSLCFTFSFTKNPLDVSNCSAMVKMIEDALVLKGIIPDDRPKFVNKIIIEVLKGNQDEVTLVVVPT